MIDGGILLMVLGAVCMAVGPLDAALAHRRWVKTIPERAPVRDAFPVVHPDPTLNAVIEQLDT